MKISEQALLDGYQGKSKGGSNISDINGERIWWDYRTQQEDGYNPVTTRERAKEISLDNNRIGSIDLGDCEAHPAIAQILQDEAELWGTEVATHDTN